jgi:EAL domain-containing protein (putative c-di-GMP-specific phosphodiesterase class I)
MKEWFASPQGIVISMVVLGAVLVLLGIYFARKSVVSSKEEAPSGFIHRDSLKEYYKALGDGEKNRCVIYVSVFLEEALALYSQSRAWRFHEILTPALSDFFFSVRSCQAAIFDEQNFVGVSDWSPREAKSLIVQKIHRIHHALARRGARSSVRIHFGIYSSLATDPDFALALSRAKQASLVAKEKGIDFAFWSLKEGKSLEERLETENRIEREIENDRFYLVYQPILEAKTGRLIGSEVLSRWKPVGENTHPPSVFLPAIGELGLRVKFDDYILKKTCKWISGKMDVRGKYLHTVNFSRITLSKPNFVSRFLSLLAQHGLGAKNLAVEVLENEEVSEELRKSLEENVRALRKEGFSVLLDDFGDGFAGYRDFSIPADIVKIDQSFIRNADTPSGKAMFCRMVEDAKAFGMKVLCEGVGNSCQEEIAIRSGCDFLQGFYYSRPVSCEAIEEIYLRGTLEKGETKA